MTCESARFDGPIALLSFVNRLPISLMPLAEKAPEKYLFNLTAPVVQPTFRCQANHANGEPKMPGVAW
jgi:hypothetical protein